MNGDIAPRHIKLRKPDLQWKTTPKVLVNPYAKRLSGNASKPEMRVVSMSFRLPLDTIHLETILLSDGTILWDYDGEPQRSDVLGGGGRFRLVRSYYDKVMVQQSLELRDLPYYTKREPQIDVITGIFVPEPVPAYKRGRK